MASRWPVPIAWGRTPIRAKTHLKGSRTEPCPIAGGHQEETNRRAFSSASPSTKLLNSKLGRAYAIQESLR